MMELTCSSNSRMGRTTIPRHSQRRSCGLLNTFLYRNKHVLCTYSAVQLHMVTCSSHRRLDHLYYTPTVEEQRMEAQYNRLTARSAACRVQTTMETGQGVLHAISPAPSPCLRNLLVSGQMFEQQAAGKPGSHLRIP